MDLSLENEEFYSIADVIGSVGNAENILFATRPFTYHEFVLLYEAIDKLRSSHPEIADEFISPLKPLSNDILSVSGYERKTAHTINIKPLSSLRMRFFYLPLEGNEEISIENSGGDKVHDGGDMKLNLSLEGNIWKRVFLYLEPQLEIRNGEESGIIKRGYLRWLIWKLDLLIGRDSIWFGPGYNGALIISNNAPPLDMFKVTNSYPYNIPWIGRFKFTFFLSRLEKDRDGVDRPYLSGLRIGLRPHRLIEIGASHTVIYGGDERPGLDLWDHLNILFFFKESNRSPGGLNDKFDNNRLAAVDITIYMPFLSHLPYLNGGKIYYERGGEDMPPRNMKHIFPTAVGQIFGMFMTTGRNDLRIEYSDNRDDVATWYKHDIYSEYRYKGRVMGHHMGGDGQDLYLGYTRRFSPHIESSLQYDRTWKRRDKNTRPEIRNGLRISSGIRVKQTCKLLLLARYDSYENYQWEKVRKAVYHFGLGTSFVW